MVVAATAFGVVDPKLQGIAQVQPRSCETFRFATAVVDDTTKGAVPVAMVEVYCVAETVEENRPRP
jgi:hypothetical protein